MLESWNFNKKVRKIRGFYLVIIIIKRKSKFGSRNQAVKIRK